jgi:hypothetical protein
VVEGPLHLILLERDSIVEIQQIAQEPTNPAAAAAAANVLVALAERCVREESFKVPLLTGVSSLLDRALLDQALPLAFKL